MLYSALIFGLISSLHCIGMCGPIAMMLPVNHKNPAIKTIQIFIYHSGRITAYAILGLIIGILGKQLSLAGFQQSLSIAIGIIMIVLAIIPEKVFAQYNFSKPIFRIISKVKQTLGKQLKKKSPDALFTIGLLNGFLPCGMVYAALFGAMGMQSTTWGVVYMMLYGIGTIPLMSAVVYFSSMLSNPIRLRVQKLIPFVVIIIGSLFILRGFGLDIAYISPGKLDLYVQTNANCH